MQTQFITPGSPWENRYIESFNGKLRFELLNRVIFDTPLEAQVIIESWRRHYLTVRPHSTLRWRPPAHSQVFQLPPQIEYLFGRLSQEPRRFSEIYRLSSIWSGHVGGTRMAKASANEEKVAWTGNIAAVQPRIRLLRSFDQRHHSYQGYALRIDGACGGQAGEFLIAVGNSAHEKYQFCVGMQLSGLSVPVADPQRETAAFFKTSGIKISREAGAGSDIAPPIHGVPPNLDTYRSRGHRRLDARTYESSCLPCLWGCRMPVGMIIDQWDSSQKRYRFETFCYGPKSCPLYRAGAARRVPGRNGMSYTEEDRVGEEATSHRGPED